MVTNIMPSCFVIVSTPWKAPDRGLSTVGLPVKLPGRIEGEQWEAGRELPPVTVSDAPARQNPLKLPPAKKKEAGHYSGLSQNNT